MKSIEYENLGKLNKPFFSQYQDSFDEFLRSGWYVLGRGVETFEKEFAEFTGTKYCVGVANGLDALRISLMSLDLPPASEVLVPSNTYIATILAIVQEGLTPILIEPSLASYNIDPTKLERGINSKTRAIIVTHLYGKACEMDRIAKIAKENELTIIEDCAQAHGASYNDRKVGTYGLGAFSFYPSKNLGALGDGGAITLNCSTLFEKIKALRNYGSPKKYENKYIGLNSRLDEIQARFLSIKLKSLEEITTHKRSLASTYREGLNDSFILPRLEKKEFDVYHIFNVRHEKRDELSAYLLKNGVKTEVHYPIPPNRQEAYCQILKGDYPISEEIHATTLSLPISYIHNQSDIEYVVDIMNKF